LKHYEMRNIPTFFDAPFGELNDLSEKTVAVVGVFCDHYGGGNPGSRIAPRQIRYSNWPEQKKTSFDSFSKEVIDLGDLNVFPLEHEKNSQILKEQSIKIYSTGSKVLIVGGDYSITPPFVQGLLEKQTYQNVGIIRVSRRLDLLDREKDATCSARRLATTAELLDDLHGEKKRLLLLGTSGITTAEEYARGKEIPGLRASWLENAEDAKLEAAVRQWAGALDAIYLSVDADVLRPGILRTSLTNVYAGLTLTGLLKTLKCLEKLPVPVVAADFVGYVPEIDLWGRDETQTAESIAGAIVRVLCKGGED
jgi:arginase family enzyme